MVAIRLRLIALFVLLVTVTLATFGVYNQMRLSNELEQRFAEREKAALLRLKISLPTALWNYDKAQTERIILAQLEPIEVMSVTVPDTKANPIAKVSRPARFDTASPPDADVRNPSVEAIRHMDPVTESLGPVLEETPIIGKVQVSFSRAYIDAALRRALTARLVEILLLDSLLVVVLAISLNMVFKPITQLRDALFDLAAQEGEEAKELPATTQKEFAEVIEGFNKS